MIYRPMTCIQYRFHVNVRSCRLQKKDEDDWVKGKRAMQRLGVSGKIGLCYEAEERKRGENVLQMT